MSPHGSQQFRGHFASHLMWEAGAVKINLINPFRLSSGNFSPIYIDMRVCLSQPTTIDLLAGMAARDLEESFARVSPYHHGDFLVAGVEMAGALYAQLLAQKMGKRFVSLRKDAKALGVGGNWLGLDLEKYGKDRATAPRPVVVLLVDDTTTDGQSKIKALRTIRDTGALCSAAFTFMDREQGARHLLNNKYQCQFRCLAYMAALLHVGEYGQYAQPSDMTEVRSYLNDPKEWHRKRGLQWTEVTT